MKRYVPAALVLASLAGCTKKEPVLPAPAAATPAAPVILQAFAPCSGALALKTSASLPDTLRGLRLQIVSQDNGDQTVGYFYTWHGYLATGFTCVRGYLPAGTGVEVVAEFSSKKAALLGSGPWVVAVRTSITDLDFKNPQGLDYAGQGLFTVTPAGYSLPFTAQFISGSLTP